MQEKVKIVCKIESKYWKNTFDFGYLTLFQYPVSHFLHIFENSRNIQYKKYQILAISILFDTIKFFHLNHKKRPIVFIEGTKSTLRSLLL